MTIHPTAVVSPAARLADGVRVGPFAVIDGPVQVGAGCVVGPHCVLLGRLALGPDNVLHAGVVLGDTPQHAGYKGEPTETVVGAGNTFREHVTVHRGMPGSATRIGDHNLFMANSHVAHDCVVGSHAIFANGAVIGGHTVVHDRAFLSGNTAVHQNCRVGRLAMLAGGAVATMDIPPFWVVQSVNLVHGVNLVGMRRAGLPSAEIQAVRTAYKRINRSGLLVGTAVAQIEAEFGHLPAVRELVEFIRGTKRGICVGRRAGDDPGDAAE